MANVITNDNIRELVRHYITDRNNLPAWIQGIPISNWDVSRVTNMDRLFSSFTNFNEPLNNWNVSNVTTMAGMFEDCNNFNKPLDNWNVSNVTDMHNMFYYCTNFNQPLNGWNVSNVTNMNCIFFRCRTFNRPLDNWNVSNVTDMAGMFRECTNFNQPLNGWDVSRVTNMNSMFLSCTIFNQPLNDWNVSNVREMVIMFAQCTNFNEPLDNWNVSRVTSMREMFDRCTSFNQDLSNWNIDRVRNFSGMFRDCVNFNINPNWQLHPSARGTTTMYDSTPLQGTVLQQAPRAPRPQRPQPPPQALQAPQQLPQGRAFEIHNAFPELNFNKFMDIIRRDNNGASNFKDSIYPLQPLITYINNDTSTTIVDTEDDPEKTGLSHDLNGEIKTRLNMYLSEHPETKDNVMEVTQFVMSQGSDYKDPYIRFLTFDCINAYGRGEASCTKGVFERVFLINKSVLIPLCSDDTNSASSSASSCKPVYRELLGCFYPDMDIDALFYQWYDINNMEEGSTSPLASASEEERKEDFRRFVLSKVPRADSTVINKFITKNENIFKTLITGGRRKRRKTRKTKMKKINRKTIKKQRKVTMKRLKRNVRKTKR